MAQVGALRGYEHVNGLALDLWEAVYPNVLLLALTDTFSTEAFYKVLETGFGARSISHELIMSLKTFRILSWIPHERGDGRG